MLLALMAALLIVLLLLSWWMQGKDALSPSALFCVGFVACAGLAFFASPMWDFEMHPRTFLVILLGTLCFVLAAKTVHDIVKRASRKTGSVQRSWALPTNNILLGFFVLLQIVVIVWSLFQLTEMYPASSITESIKLFDSANKFADQPALGFAFPVGTLRNICNTGAMLICYIVAQELVLKRFRRLVLPFVSLLLAMIMSLEGGGRAGAVGLLVYVMICGLLIARHIRPKGATVSRKAVVGVAIVAVVIVVSFQASLTLLGRTSNYGFFEYLAIYVGAEIPNLDIFLQTDFPRDNGVFGYMTFITSIRWLGIKLGVDAWVYQLDLPFQTMNGHGLGNVYTTFYAPIYDFGYMGMVVLVILMAVVSQLVYEKAVRFDSGRHSCIWIIVYSAIAYALLMSFFSNKFYEGIFAIGFIRTIIYLVVCYLAYTRLRLSSFAERDEAVSDHLDACVVASVDGLPETENQKANLAEGPLSISGASPPK